MGDGIKSMYEDIDEYERLCKRYGEEVVIIPEDSKYRARVDSLGPHHQALRKHAREEDRTT